ncbi:MAG: hypothetical protein LH614_08320 [Pyrinomonadaceae bacterium]|nr:hypothetical protein [Pyrinomonadaceae bacterium]
MPYKPKFCCQCGEKIDGIDRRFWASRRFCELCETDLKIHEWLPRFLVGIAVLFGLFGIGNYLQKPEKPLSVAPLQFAALNTKSDAMPPKPVAQVSPAASVQLPSKPPIEPVVSSLAGKQPDAPKIEAAEKVYFCGAPTKKGTMCSRRVKNGGRCWQHEGQTAMLPQEKLLAAR